VESGADALPLPALADDVPVLPALAAGAAGSVPLVSLVSTPVLLLMPV
jgi:hypothetical protein